MAEVLNAFGGQQRLRDELEGELAQRGALTRIWLQGFSGDERLRTIASEFALPVPLVALATSLARGLSYPDGATYLADLLLALPLDRPADQITTDWMLGIASHEFQPALANSPASEEARAVVALIERARTDTVTPQEWRDAARLLGFVDGLSPEQEDASEVLQAMAWDFRSMPLAILDVVRACQNSERNRVHRELGWSVAERDDHAQSSQAYAEQAAVELNPAALTTDEERAAFGEAFRRRIAELTAEAGKTALFARSEEVRVEAERAIAAWHGHQRELLRSIIASFCAEARSGGA